MKKIFNIVAVAAALGVMTSCTDILDTAPYDKLSSGTMWTTEESVDQGVIGVYYSLQRPFSGSGFIGASSMIGYYGYEALGMTGQGEYGMQNLFTKSVNPSNGFFLTTWQWMYNGVHRANAAIAGIENSPINAEKKARLIAECKVLRAFFYDRLNILFGNNGVGVPLYTEPVDPVDCNKGQSSEKEVWAQVIQDLSDAIAEPNLPDNQIQGEGRVSKGAAYALRGKAYLITKEYDKAADDFAKVGECGYRLFPDYRQLFKVENERCQEMILSVQYIEDPTGYGTAIQKYCAAFTQGSKDSRGCWGDLQITPALVNLYEAYDGQTVRDFAWENYLSGWKTVTDLEASEGHTKYRKVFFIRDKYVNGMEIHPTVTKAVDTELDRLPESVRAFYLPEGNEARLKTAYANRDPRLAYNVVTPYADYLGVNSNSTEEAWYTFRWPVAGKYYADQAAAEPNANPDLPDTYYASGFMNAQAEFKYIQRKFIG
ncbi:MAG: RagB/SusD family nutrient uptake outer membrane protein, partial [Candidatus Amulumruptor sp.]|nr:RagB/SusD family nutrient uptake outer membrane protein [Candidatus Amulumruptor sp.]